MILFNYLIYLFVLFEILVDFEFLLEIRKMKIKICLNIQKCFSILKKYNTSIKIYYIKAQNNNKK